MIRFAELKKVARFGLLGAIGCLAGCILGVPLLHFGLPEATATGAPSLVSRSAAPAAPPEFKSRLEKTGAKTGAIQISLIWDGPHDLDLHCFDPNSDDISFSSPRSRSGGQLDVDSNAGCEKNTRDKPVENIVWDAGSPPEGPYQVLVHFFTPCPRVGRIDPNRKNFETPFQVRILADGEEKLFSNTATYEIGRNNQVLVHNFRIGPKVKIEAPAEATVVIGNSLKLPFELTRVSTPGPATVTANRLPTGLKAEPVVVPEGKTSGTITITSSGATVGTGGIELAVSADGKTATAPVSLTLVEGVRWSWLVIVVLGAWTALLASGLTAALVIGQNLHTGRKWSAGGLPIAAAGAAAAGALSGAVGQGLLFLFAMVSQSLGGVGFFVGWLLLGTLLGLGVSFFIPNLDRKKAALAGLVGGGLGATAFLIASLAADWVGQVTAAAVLGFAIGLMVALVEVAFRRAWLEVRFGGGEQITVNLGPEPVKVGDDRGCTVWARGAPAVALRYWIRDGRVVCDDKALGGSEQLVGDGDQRQAGPVTVTVRTGTGGFSPAASPRPVNVAPRPIPMTPRPAPPPTPMSPPPAAVYKPPVPPPAAPRPAPPVPPVIAIKPPLPRPAPPMPVTAAAARPAPPAPPKPVLPTAAKPPAKPPAPTKPMSSPAATGDKCPTPNCGRSASGAAGKRYCMVCDHYF